MSANRLLFLLGFLLVSFLLCAMNSNVVANGPANAEKAAKLEKEVEAHKTEITAKKEEVVKKKDDVIKFKDAAKTAADASKAELEKAKQKGTAAKEKVDRSKEATKEATKTSKSATTPEKKAEAEEKIESIKTLIEEAGGVKGEAAATLASAKSKKDEATVAKDSATEKIVEIEKLIEAINGLVVETEKTKTAVDEIPVGESPNKEKIEESMRNVAEALTEIKKIKKIADDNSNESKKSLEEATNALAGLEDLENEEQKLTALTQEIEGVKTLVDQSEKALAESLKSAPTDGYFFVTNGVFDGDSAIPESSKCSADEVAKAGCKANSKCYRVNGQPTCLCYPGFTSANPKTAECTKNPSMTCQGGSHNCNANATCKLHPVLGVGCKCNSGFKGDGVFCSNSMASVLNIIFVIAVVSTQLFF